MWFSLPYVTSFFRVGGLIMITELMEVYFDWHREIQTDDRGFFLSCSLIMPASVLIEWLV